LRDSLPDLLYDLILTTIKALPNENNEKPVEAPYEGVTGEPVDWDSMNLTSTGLAHRGHVFNIIVNGTTGMISFEIFKQQIDWRVLSERALVVHKPRQAFIRRDFKPEF